jgi:CheY-like chemotaxis protein
MTPEAEVARVLVVGADPALAGLLEEWLAEAGCRMVDDEPQVILVDLHLPRQAGAGAARELRARHPGTPLIALSSGFFAGVEANGAVARTLGVEAVLPKPLTREALVAALRKVLPQLE